MSNFDKAIKIIMAEPPEPRYPSYYADLLREADIPDKDDGNCSETPNGSDVISRQQATKAIEKSKLEIWLNDYDHCNGYNEGLETAIEEIKNLPSAQPDEKLEKCRFEYINACRIVTFSTPDTTKKDISDAYAVIKALQPIFGDVTF